MQSIKKGNLVLVILAVLLSAFNGLVSVLTVMVFSGHESSRMWISIYVPAFLWVIACFCYKFPGIGLFTYAAVLALSVFLCVAPFSHAHTGVAQWQACCYNLRFAIAAFVLLTINATIAKTSL